MAQYSPLRAFNVGMQAIDDQLAKIRRLGLTERQLELNFFWSHYRATQYEHRSITWDGSKALSQIEKETVSRNAVLPMGFVDKGGQYDEVPLGLRIPTAPHHLVRVVVHRFTGLLFSAKMHPRLSVPDDAALQSWIETLCKVSRIWSRFEIARNFGGGMGSVALSFRFAKGRPMISIHDARWCTPTFVDHETGEISALEIRYMYPVEEMDRHGKPELVWYWYRRIIDANSDVIFRPAPVGKDDKAGIEPNWIEEKRDVHQLGECPAVWIRNTPTDEIDGDPDCLGAYPIQEAIDRLISQADQGAVENADPTLEIDSDELRLDQIKKGSRHAFKLEKGGSAKYVEMSGSGIDSALKVSDVHRRNFLELVQCILDTEESTGAMTATEVERRYSPMHERGDIFREQYGETGIKPLVGKIIRATIRMSSGQMTPKMDQQTGLRIVQQVMPGLAKMPPGLRAFSEDQLELTWPDWVTRGPSDAMAASGAVANARTAQVLDKESALAYLAGYFDIDDPAAAQKRLEQETGGADQQMMADMQAMGGGGGGGGVPPEGATPAEPTAPAPAAPPQAPPDEEPLLGSPPPLTPGVAPPQAPAPVAPGREPPSAALMSTIMTIVERVTAKMIPRDSGIELVKIALPGIDPMTAEKLIGPAAEAPLPPELPKPSVPGKAPPSGPAAPPAAPNA